MRRVADEIERNIYSRFTNPNVTEFVDKMCSSRARGRVCHGDGMAASATFAGCLGSGTISCRGARSLDRRNTILTKIIPRFGITHSYVDVADGSTGGGGDHPCHAHDLRRDPDQSGARDRRPGRPGALSGAVCSWSTTAWRRRCCNSH
jgi:hypothetical protein